ncbi:MAG TPA: DUF2254 family protein [Gemmatimonadales bacterium]|nr:DUF2254 family protein [Gemmatimonadales bacterium]
MRRPGRPDERFRDTVRRAFAEFLGLPTLIVIAFLAVAIGSYVLDRGSAGSSDPVRRALERHLFRSPEATRNLLGTVAGGIITVTSITISLLLVAIQQSASTMTAQVFDQFLRRKANQFCFGFLVGLAVFALITLATVTPGFTPVYGGTMTLLLTAVALLLLIFLMYISVNQMRPAVIVASVHDHTIAAWAGERAALRRVRRTPARLDARAEPVHADRHGFVTHLDFDAMARAAEAAGKGAEVSLRVLIGSFVSFGDAVAELRGAEPSKAEAARGAVRRAIRLERKRDFETDACYGILQLETIGWTSVSSSKSNPMPGILCIHALRDLLARWSDEHGNAEAEREAAAREHPPLPVVYDDEPFDPVFDALESLGVAASESMQHQTLAEILEALAVTYARVPIAWRPRANAMVLRLLSTLGDHVLTAKLETAVSRLGTALREAGELTTAAALRDAADELAASVGHLGARSTRGES